MVFLGTALVLRPPLVTLIPFSYLTFYYLLYQFLGGWHPLILLVSKTVGL